MYVHDLLKQILTNSDYLAFIECCSSKCALQTNCTITYSFAHEQMSSPCLSLDGQHLWFDNMRCS